MLATQPGLGALLDRRLRSVESRAPPRLESDGRSDLLVIESPVPPDATALGAEDLFVLLTETAAKPSASATAAALFEPARWQQALDRAREMGVRIGASTGFRVIVRVRSERQFKRTELRAALISEVQRWRPRWRIADPAALELWALETRPAHFRLAARVSTPATRQRGGRTIERPGSLRPAVAAAMVAEAGRARGILLDPFCGGGTILAEAGAAGWRAIGRDIDAEAVSAARVNAPDAQIECGDAAALPFENASLRAVISNLPFGLQHKPRTGTLPEDRWWDAVLRELSRVAEPGAPIIVLHPGDAAFGVALRWSALSAEPVAKVTTLGQRTTIWRLRS